MKNGQGFYTRKFEKEMDKRFPRGGLEKALNIERIIEIKVVRDYQNFKETREKIKSDYSGPLSGKQIDEIKKPDSTKEDILMPPFKRISEFDKYIRNQIKELETEYNGK